MQAIVQGRSGGPEVLGDAVPAETGMKAVVQRRYGPPEVLEYTDVARPVVGKGDVLVGVRRFGPPGSRSSQSRSSRTCAPSPAGSRQGSSPRSSTARTS